MAICPINLKQLIIIRLQELRYLLRNMRQKTMNYKNLKMRKKLKRIYLLRIKKRMMEIPNRQMMEETQLTYHNIIQILISVTSNANRKILKMNGLNLKVESSK